MKSKPKTARLNYRYGFRNTCGAIRCPYCGKVALVQYNVVGSITTATAQTTKKKPPLMGESNITIDNNGEKGDSAKAEKKGD